MPTARRSCSPLTTVRIERELPGIARAASDEAGFAGDENVALSVPSGMGAWLRRAEGCRAARPPSGGLAGGC